MRGLTVAEVWEDLRRNGAALDEAMFNAAAGAFARAGDMNRARSLVDEYIAEGLEPGVRMCEFTLIPPPYLRMGAPF